MDMVCETTDRAETELPLSEKELPFKTKLLREQLQLLAEKSRECTNVGELVALTHAMAEICNMRDLSGKTLV